MDHLKALGGLLEFQRINDGAMQPLVDFVAEETLREFSIICTFLVILAGDGSLHYPYANGKNIEHVQEGPAGILDEHVPGHDAFVNGLVVEMGGILEYPFYRPDKVDAMFPDGFQSSLAVPIPDFGALKVFFQERYRLDGRLETFFRSIGEILSTNLKNGHHSKDFNVDHVEKVLLPHLPLTPRQWAIKDAMLRGLTNGAIAREMNFSESLIRHETIRIYSKMGINGRKELFALEAEKANNQEKMEA
jgi:DNA-binding CsgD family transcriptional regulator